MGVQTVEVIEIFLEMRNKTLDIARGLGIFLVVLGHNWMVVKNPGELFRVIYSFHVPLFFFLAGVFFNANGTLKELVIQKFQTLIKPYLVVLLCVGLMSFLFNSVNPLNILFGVLFSTDQSISWVPLWFLPHLFIVVLVSWLILNLFELKNNLIALRFFVACLFVVGGFVVNLFEMRFYDIHILSVINYEGLIGFPFCADLLFVSSAFFLLGYVFRENLKKFQGDGFIVFISIFLFFTLHYFYNETIDLNKRIYGDPLISTLQALSGIYIILYLSRLISLVPWGSAVFSYVGSGSLFILIFHGVLQGKVTHKLQYLFSSIQRVDAFLGLIISISLSLMLWELAKRIPLISILFFPKRKF